MQSEEQNGNYLDHKQPSDLLRGYEQERELKKPVEKVTHHSYRHNCGAMVYTDQENHPPEVLMFAPGERWLGRRARDGKIALSIWMGLFI